MTINANTPKRKPLKTIANSASGNIMAIFAFALMPMMLATGMGIDYSRAQRARTKFDAAADAAVLSGVTAPMLKQSDAVAKANVISVFNKLVSGLPDVTYDPQSLVVTVQPDPSGLTNLRSIKLDYQAKSKNYFGSFFNVPTLPVNNIVTNNAIGGTSPNIDFYLMMDTSPSMLFPTTQAGINSMSSLTGCAYACHQGNQAAGAPDLHNVNGVWMDSYQIARNNNIELRFDAEKTAVSSLMTTAYSSGTTNKATYQMNVSTFDVSQSELQSLITITDGTASYPTTNRNIAAASAGTAAIYVPWENSKNSTGTFDDDQQTHFDDMMTNLNTSGNAFYIPTPGNGTSVAGDKPKKILFIVTDGFDENSRYNSPGFGAIDTTKCKSIRDRGIRIAILYLQTYASGWAQGDNQIPASTTALASCASAGLMYTVAKDQDIATALANLFNQAVASTRLTQ